jgi:hypothetical protein
MVKVDIHVANAPLFESHPRSPVMSQGIVNACVVPHLGSTQALKLNRPDHFPDGALA